MSKQRMMLPNMQSEEPKRDWREDFKHENGNYQCICFRCDNTFFGHKRRVECCLCAHPEQNDFELDFSRPFTFISSIKKETNLTDEEASTMLWLIEMWENKRYMYPPTNYELIQFPK